MRVASSFQKNMEAVETFKHKGLEIEIFRDENAMSPKEWDNENIFLVGYHRNFYVENSRITKDVAIDIANNEKTDETKAVEKEYHIFELEAYIHSGVVLAISQEGNFCDRQWDVSQLGLVLVSKKETRLKAKAKKMAVGLIAEWNDYLSGNVYGYMVGGGGGCWGFYGDIEKSGIVESAKDEAEMLAKEKVEKHLKRLKGQILNGVALEKRESLSI
jgi:hypothetical protein